MCDTERSEVNFNKFIKVLLMSNWYNHRLVLQIIEIDHKTLKYHLIISVDL
jgi:hypothetical protein